MSELVPVRNPANDTIAFVGAEYADHLVDEHDPPWSHVDVEEAEVETGQVVQLPARNASKPTWVEFAVEQGVDAEEAEASTRDELADRFGG